MTFSEQIVYAMFKPSKYKEMLELKKRRFVLFTFVMMIVLGIVTFVVPTGAYIAGFGGFTKLFSEKMAPLKYQNETLTIEKPFELALNGTHILIDTEADTVDDSKLNKNGVYISLGSKKVKLSIVLDKEATTYQTMELDYLLPDGLDNDMLVSFIPGIYAYFVLTFIMTGVGFFLKYALFAVILAMLVSSFAKRLELALTFGELFMICFYGQTFGMILVNFNAAIGLLPEILVSLVAVFVSVRMITGAIASMYTGNKF